MTEFIADNIVEIDTQLGGWEHITAGYLVTGESPVLIETGSQSSAPLLIAELQNLGISPSDLAAVVLTHIHLDHAGGVGDIARVFPKAKVYVHPSGARHLADPSRLINSASMVYGPLLDSLYGRLDPTPADRIIAVEEGDTIEVTKGLHLEALMTPGHAKHHLSLWHEPTGTMFCGDAVGVKLPEVGILWPATPPPDFDLALATQSLEAMKSRSPSHLAFAHYGRFANAVDILDEGKDLLRDWCRVAEAAMVDGREIETALEEAFVPDLKDLDPTARDRLLTLSGVHANAMGISRWLTKRSEHNGQNSRPAD
ncbi:MBL fold metallo-hydrolase [Ferrimicrobium acidiphilum]|uniref:MBL fold metallo-hydrolase n=1 Tax=Ferrimicrobium acidiphilum TaxID=121039 RepID=UPI0023F22FD3|nr:MBL fold metallo-hydrolase [Ferrimicrobium acidiphilum]